MTGATYRQLDHWCRGGVFGEKFQDPGSGTKRRYEARDIFHVAVVTRLAETMHALQPDMTTSGSRKVYVDVVRMLRGETVENIFIDSEDDLYIIPTGNSALTIAIDDLRVQFSEENLLNG